MLHIHRHVSALREFRPIVLTQKREGSWTAEDVNVVPRSPWRFVGREVEKLTGKPWQISGGEAARFDALLRENDCTLLHVFFGNAAVHLLPLFRRSSLPLIVSFHGSDVAGAIASPAYQAARAEMFARADLVPCRSRQLAAKVESLGGPTEKLRIMRTIVPEISFRARKAPTDGAWRLVQAGRLVPKKGMKTALLAFADFAKTYPHATFTIAGTGPLAAELSGHIRELRLSDKVELAGFLDQEALQRLFLSSHIFLQPSETTGGDVEGVPNALLEAMAGGLPVVATRHGGIPEVLTDGVNGLLCEESDPAALAAALRRLAGDEILYSDLSHRGSHTVREEFSAERGVAAVEELYREAILAHSARNMIEKPAL